MCISPLIFVFTSNMLLVVSKHFAIKVFVETKTTVHIQLVVVKAF